eukprot:10024-Heterococcus_DN1.PRE.3
MYQALPLVMATQLSSIVCNSDQDEMMLSGVYACIEQVSTLYFLFLMPAITAASGTSACSNSVGKGPAISGLAKAPPLVAFIFNSAATVTVKPRSGQ